MTRLMMICLFLGSFSVGPLSAVLAQIPENQAIEDRWQTLFDGTNTEHWRNYNHAELNEGWEVQDGALVRAQKGAGDIITREKYGAFILELEFKISPQGNSGIMFHVVEQQGKPWHTGPEIQIQDNAAGRDPQKAGWLYQLYDTDVDSTKPAGEWNKLRIVISPQGCKHTMNGVDYVSYNIGSDDWNARVAKSKFASHEGFGKAGLGHICLQDHGNEVAYRNIRIRRLDGEFPQLERK